MNPCLHVLFAVIHFEKEDHTTALVQLVAVATIRERRLFRSALAKVRLLFESSVYSRVASIGSYTVGTYNYI